MVYSNRVVLILTSYLTGWTVKCDMFTWGDDLHYCERFVWTQFLNFCLSKDPLRFRLHRLYIVNILLCRQNGDRSILSVVPVDIAQRLCRANAKHTGIRLLLSFYNMHDHKLIWIPQSLGLDKSFETALIMQLHVDIYHKYLIYHPMRN